MSTRTHVNRLGARPSFDFIKSTLPPQAFNPVHPRLFSQFGATESRRRMWLALANHYIGVPCTWRIWTQGGRHTYPDPCQIERFVGTCLGIDFAEQVVIIDAGEFGVLRLRPAIDFKQVTEYKE